MFSQMRQQNIATTVIHFHHHTNTHTQHVVSASAMHTNVACVLRAHIMHILCSCVLTSRNTPLQATNACQAASQPARMSPVSVYEWRFLAVQRTISCLHRYSTCSIKNTHRLCKRLCAPAATWRSTNIYALRANTVSLSLVHSLFLSVFVDRCLGVSLLPRRLGDLANFRRADYAFARWHFLSTIFAVSASVPLSSHCTCISMGLTRGRGRVKSATVFNARRRCFCCWF